MQNLELTIKIRNIEFRMYNDEFTINNVQLSAGIYGVDGSEGNLFKIRR